MPGFFFTDKVVCNSVMLICYVIIRVAAGYFSMLWLLYTLFYISNTFISNAWLKLAKNQAKAKQHLELELSLFKNYSLSSPTLSSKNNRIYSKKYTKDKYVSFNFIWLIAMKMWLEMKNRSQRRNLNRPRPRHGQKYT